MSGSWDVLLSSFLRERLKEINKTQCPLVYQGNYILKIPCNPRSRTIDVIRKTMKLY